MAVIIKDNIFVLETENTHYALASGPNGIEHLHWGKKCRVDDYEYHEVYEVNSNHAAMDFCKTEYIPFGSTMYREVALKCTFADGCRETVLDFIGAEKDGNTLRVKLEDRAYGLRVNLVYKTFDGTDIIERYTEFENVSDKDIELEKAASAELNFPSLKPYCFTNTNGSWGGEFLRSSHELKSGSLVYESRKGTTGHHHLPAIIASRNATEEFGEVYFAVLSSLGNFKVSVTRDFTGKTRGIIGVNEFDFSKTLKAGEKSRTPSAYCGFSNGFGEMSNMLSRFAIDKLLPKEFAQKELPVLYNSWEATMFDVNEEGQLALAKKAAKIGCELFVMDDGWFGERNNDKAGLGDWFVNHTKFPNGLKPLIDGVNELGMDFGLWVEPEMVNPDSNLYRAHPEWTYHYPTREPSLLRNQLVLNMTKPEVFDYLLTRLDEILTEYNIKYIKWDMNRPFSEIGAENLENPKEIWQRHTQAVYDIVDILRERHPDVQFEACSSGGGRADLGALSHFDMAWTSDNTDPIDRLEIQHGYSLVYPIKCMRAWVTDANRDNRPITTDFRFVVSMQGSLSIGSNLLLLNDEELEKYAKYIELYKQVRHTVQFGKLYRLRNFKDDKIYFNGYVNEDKSQAVYFSCTNAGSTFGRRFVNVRFLGLDENSTYHLKSLWREMTKSGAYFANVGIEIDYSKPLECEIFLMEKVD